MLFVAGVRHMGIDVAEVPIQDDSEYFDCN